MADVAMAVGYKGNVTNKLLGLRNKALILSLWQSGVRNNCLCKWTIGMIREYLYPTVRVPVPLKVTAEIDTKISMYGRALLLHLLK
jgi:hypothetical protein